MNTVTRVPAAYSPSKISRFKGNPFIEALPPLGGTKAAFATKLAHYPDPPSAAIRALSEVERLIELRTLSDLVFPFPQYQEAGLIAASMMRESYVARNPLTAIDRQRRHALATGGMKSDLYPSDWKSSASGHTMMSISGMGKTTFLNATLLHYPQVIEHKQYKGTPLDCRQITYLKLSIPHDGTLRSLCLDFFSQVDRILGTKYHREARGYRTIAPMQFEMIRVANSASLGVLFVDELQNLRAAQGSQADHVLNMLSNLIEGGISLFTFCTPAVQSILEGSVRNTRKLTSYGLTFLEPMTRKSPIWKEFCETCWDYTYVKHKGRLTHDIMDAWYRSSAGDTAFAVLAFMLTQHSEIGGAERVDAVGFERTAETRMAFLQPAIKALLSKKPDALMAFDDLIFSERFRSLRKLLGVQEPQRTSSAAPEFEEVGGGQRNTRNRNESKGRSRKKKSSIESIELPTENPLLVDQPR